MRLRVFLAALAAAMLLSQSAAVGQSPPPGTGDGRQIIVTVQYNFALPVKPNDVDSQRTVMEQGRTIVYQLTAKECDMLLATIASSCQLERLNLQTNIPRHHRPGEELINLSANAQFKIELKPKS